MKIGLYGYEGSGASTLFSAITGLFIEPGGKPQTHIGTVKVPDERLQKLADIYNPKKIVPAEIVFHDFAPEEKNNQKQVLANLSDVKSMDMLCLLIRDFESPYLTKAPDAPKELEAILTDMVITDLDVLERYLERQQKVKEKDAFIEKNAKRMVEHLNEGLPLRLLDIDDETKKRFKGFTLLTLKPMLVVINKSEDNMLDPIDAAITTLVEDAGCKVISLCAAIEADIATLSKEEQGPFLADLGLEHAVTERFIQAVYELANYISFFTVGPDEVRAWPISNPCIAKKAAGTIHTDLERGFIRAEVFHYDDFMQFGSEQQLKKEGKIRLEGKEYIVKDGDIMTIRFNV